MNNGEMGPKVQEVLVELRQKSQTASGEHEFVETEMILCDVLGLEKTELLLKKEMRLSLEQYVLLGSLIERNFHGEPVSYILGYKDFYKSRFKVSPAVLIPRSDSETLVEVALSLAEPKYIADLGSGSGCLGLSLLKEWSNALLSAWDISQEALEITRTNADILGLTQRLETYLGDPVESEAAGKFDLVISNPPYIELGDTRLSERVLDYEPELALFAEGNGLAYYEKWTPWSYKSLKTNGSLIYECGEGQAAKVYDICLKAGFTNISIIKDLNQIERVVVAQKN